MLIRSHRQRQKHSPQCSLHYRPLPITQPIIPSVLTIRFLMQKQTTNDFIKNLLEHILLPSQNWRNFPIKILIHIFSVITL